MTGWMPSGERDLTVLVVAVLVFLGFAGAVMLRRTPDDVEYGLTEGQRRARRDPDGRGVSNADRQVAAQRKRARRAERRLQIAGRRQGRHRIEGPPPDNRWWRRTARRT